MGLEVLLFAIIILVAFAIFDLMVGVSNDAVNFLNSSLGSRVAPRYIIMIIASLGILTGVTFSSGMMEVARKGIFHPQFFTMPELMIIFLAVMLTDVILLDVFNTFGLPTSTTVSIVFELLGGAVAVSAIKIAKVHGGLADMMQYINTSKAMIIILGILLSIVVAFFFGAFVQFLSRLLFTFDFSKRLKRYGALWGGVALSFIVYFILIKGAKGSSFMTGDMVAWIKTNAHVILFAIFAVSAFILQILLFLKVNILKPIVLIGTFALAMAFAANDLMNFIGVPLAGYHAYRTAMVTDTPLTVLMGALGRKVPTQTHLLLVAGVIMVVTLWLSRKARNVTETEISLGAQEEGFEKFESTPLSRALVRMVISFFNTLRSLVPVPVRNWVSNRFDPTHFQANVDDENRPSFDLLRASVNLMVASAIISYATSKKLPLSTTYVTFMVAMGASFADQAWGRESAVYRVTGVLTVVGGWFMTAFMAFTISSIFAVVMFYAKTPGLFLILILAGYSVWKNHHKFSETSQLKEKGKIFDLKRVSDVNEAVATTFVHVGHYLRELRESLDRSLEGLFNQNEYILNVQKKECKKVQHWANVVIANVFKSMRLIQKETGNDDFSYKYGQTIRGLQKLADGHRDIVMRSYIHVSNHHKGLLEEQVKELSSIKQLLLDLLSDVEDMFDKKHVNAVQQVIEKDRDLRKLAEQYHKNQMDRIRSGESKTRLSILFYDIIGNAIMISKQNLKLLRIFEESFSKAGNVIEFDLD